MFLTKLMAKPTSIFQPLQSDYSKVTFRKMLGNYFEGSYKSLVSFIVNEEKLSEKEIQELQALIAEQATNKSNS
jgi:BlaI family transcriptional regulator, penicillinase repressor